MDCRIKELRKAAGMTQMELAEEVGVVQSTVAMWETGGAYPETVRLPRIAEVLQCSIDDLFGGRQSNDL